MLILRPPGRHLTQRSIFGGGRKVRGQELHPDHHQQQHFFQQIAQGAIENRHLFQMADERDVQTRNKELLDADLTDINKDCRWDYAKLGLSKTADGL